MTALVFAGFGIGQDAGNPLILRKTNLATLTVWGLWWPAMIALALAAGRLWCAVCPMELVNRLALVAGRALGLRQIRLGRTLRAGWIAVALYLLLQFLVAGLSIHRVPHDTAVFLVTLLGLALVTGLVFRDTRSFCRGFCPAGALLSVYGRNTPIQLEMRDPAVCVDCATLDCIAVANRHRFDARSCPSLLLPFDRDPSSGCVLCLQCAKVCPHDNVGFGLAAADSPIRRRTLLRPSEAAFVMIALGFVMHEVVGEVAWADAVFHAVPFAFAARFPGVPVGWLEAIWFLAIAPALFWFAIAAAARLAGCRGTPGRLLTAAATGAAPVVAAAHLGKAAAKFAAWSGYLPLAIRDPRGLDTLRDIGDGDLAAPVAWAGLSSIGWCMLLLTAVIAVRSWSGARHPAPASPPAARTGLAGASLLFAAVFTAWVRQP